MIRAVEDHAIEPALWKAWSTYMQYMEQTDATDTDLIEAVGPEAALMLSQMSAAERYAAFVGGRSRVKVSGLSAVHARMRELQELLAMMGAVGQNPVLMQACLQTTSPAKILSRMFKTLNIDPETVSPDPHDQPLSQATMQGMLQSAGFGGGRGGGAGPMVSTEGG